MSLLSMKGIAVDSVTERAPTFGPYVIDQELGRGAFGVVYRAHHQDDPATPVALKVVEAPGQLDRLLLEPALLAKLDHPCIVRVLDYFAHRDTTLAIALEFVPGTDLRAAVDAAERFPAGQVRELLLQIGGALAEAHAQGIVHRDLKPSNILVDRTGGQVRYVLTDFGVGAEEKGLRSEKRLAGTFQFMAPEQLRGRPGPQSDLWALGVVAYRMLTGRYPFPGPTLAELARQIQLTTPPPPSRVIGEPIDPDLERAVLRLLDRSETERVASAAELLALLGHQGDSRSVLAGRTTERFVTRVGQRQRSLDESLRRDVRWNWIWLGIWAGLYLLLKNPVSGLFIVAGLVGFYVAQLKLTGWRRTGALAASLGLLAVSWFVAKLFEVLMEGTFNATPATRAGELMANLGPWMKLAAVVVILIGSVPFLLPVLACGCYARLNRLRRERVLLQAAAGAGSDEFLELMRRELDYRTEDVGFHLKYAEALAARGDDRAAAIEARLLLVQDPYHFTGNLLLAQSYFRLGLLGECEKVCTDYLAVAGYCFEFAELRQQCRASRRELA